MTTTTHDGLEQPFDHAMCYTVLGRMNDGSGFPVSCSEWAERSKNLALSRASAARELTVARVLDSEQWLAWQSNMDAGGPENVPSRIVRWGWGMDTADEVEELRRLAIVSLMESGPC